MKLSMLPFVLLSMLAIRAHAAPNDGVVGPYARVEVGRHQAWMGRAYQLALAPGPRR